MWYNFQDIINTKLLISTNIRVNFSYSCITCYLIQDNFSLELDTCTHLKHILKSKTVSRIYKYKVNIYKTILKLVVKFESESWTMSER